LNVLVIYDSVYGNTGQVANYIASGFDVSDKVIVSPVNDIEISSLESIDLLIIGSPTQGGRCTIPVKEYLERLTMPNMSRIKVAVFDTRISSKWVSIFGFAASKISASLKDKGAAIIIPPEPFYVFGTKGPLKQGEQDKAIQWGKMLAEKMRQRTY
jgi:flavodoxin I